VGQQLAIPIDKKTGLLSRLAISKASSDQGNKFNWVDEYVAASTAISLG
jgi:hypothetical protein